jgi:hypothetical protein
MQTNLNGGLRMSTLDDEQNAEIDVPIENMSTFSFAPQPVGGASTLVERYGIFVYGSAVLPPNPKDQDLIVKAISPTTDPLFSVARPRVIQLQPRQSDNNDNGWTDQFALQVIETSRDFIRFRIRRMDNGAQPTGWGQSLRIDILVIDDGSER